MNIYIFHRPVITEIVYDKIIFVVNYGNRMGLLLECESNGNSVVANKGNRKENVLSQPYMLDINLGIHTRRKN